MIIYSALLIEITENLVKGLLSLSSMFRCPHILMVNNEGSRYTYNHKCDSAAIRRDFGYDSANQLQKNMFMRATPLGVLKN